MSYWNIVIYNLDDKINHSLVSDFQLTYRYRYERSWHRWHSYGYSSSREYHETANIGGPLGW